ncbi:MAG: hypothetical protein ACM31C_03920 [Acidobacteriota bacterium]
MKSFALVVSLLGIGLVGCLDSTSPTDPSTSTSADELDALGNDPPALGKHWARGSGPSGGTSSPQLVYHSGAIMTSTAVTAIYWGTSWSDPTFAGDKISGLDTLYGGLGGTTYLTTNTEYTGTNGQVTTNVSYSGHVLDTGSSLTRTPKTSAIQAEVCKMIGNPVANGYYPVYTDLPRGHAGYCAWHSYGTCNGVPVQFGFFFSLDNDTGCDVNAIAPHSQALDSLANVTGHELSEMMTDPRNGGWYDSSGNENADKCAWTFPPDGGQTIAGQQWQIQGNWSNNAYTSGTGYTPRNTTNQPGCLDGSTQYP